MNNIGTGGAPLDAKTAASDTLRNAERACLGYLRIFDEWSDRALAEDDQVEKAASQSELKLAQQQAGYAKTIASAALEMAKGEALIVVRQLLLISELESNSK